MTRIGADTDQVEYRLGGGHGCDERAADRRVGYRADSNERALVWMGSGLDTVGIQAGTVLGPDQFDWARALMRGRHPVTGEKLVKPKLAVPVDAKLPLGALVDAVELQAARSGVPAAALFVACPKLGGEYARAVRAVKANGELALLRADTAGALADAAGVNVAEVWGDGEYAAALSRLADTVTITTRRGRRVVRVPRRVVAGNLGYDATFTFPKSYSVLMAFAPEDAAQRIETCLAQAVTDTFGWLQSNTAYVMRGKHGEGKSARRLGGSGFLGWAMTHRAARPAQGRDIGDPHWHVHLTIANMTRGADGKWSTVAAGGRDLMRHAPAADAIVQALARHRLATEFGADFERNPRTGVWEVAGIDDDVLRAFSKRGQSIQALLTDLGFDPDTAAAAARRFAAGKTRRAKTSAAHEVDATLRGAWQGEARALGLDPNRLAANALGRRPAAPGGAEAVDVDHVGEWLALRLQDPETGLTANRRRFSRVEAIAALAGQLPAGAADIATIEALTDRALTHAGFIQLSPPAGEQVKAGAGARRQLAALHMSNAALYTTGDVVAAEEVILSAVGASRPGQQAAAVNPNTVELAQAVVEAAQGYELSVEQARVLRRLTTQDRAIDAVIGAPGTGKTTLMRAARAAWEAEGFNVGGAATQATTGHNLLGESGIRTHTIASLLAGLDTAERARLSEAHGWVDTTNIADPLHPTAAELAALAGARRLSGHELARAREAAQYGGLSNLDVLVIDEASMTDDRALARIVAETNHTGTKLVLIGDDRQLRGVGCGSLFARIHAEVDGERMTDMRRQRDNDERAAVAAWRGGNYRDALLSWAGRGRLHASQTTDEALTNLVARWAQLRQGAPDAHSEIGGLLVLADTNEACARINTAAQAVAAAQGRIGDPARWRGKHGQQLWFAECDHVIVRINDRNQANHRGDDVLNGFRGVIKTIHHDRSVTVEWKDPADATLSSARLPAEYVANGGLELGYAITVHRCQGLTAEGSWATPGGETVAGNVLKLGPSRADAATVAASRHRHRYEHYVALEQVEDPAQHHSNGGPPRDQNELAARIINALDQHAQATTENPDDRPVVDDLGRDPATAAREQAAYQAFKQRNRPIDPANRPDQKRRQAGRRPPQPAQPTPEPTRYTP